MDTIRVPSFDIPVRRDVDVCVVGGSCTGLFAAVRAARLGARVALVERQNCLGGMATAGLVNVWHNVYDITGRERVIGGLTAEVLAALDADGSLEYGDFDSTSHIFNPEALKPLLDELAAREGVELLLNTQFAGCLAESGRAFAAVVANKDGVSAIRARFFIDATGDGDLLASLGEPYYTLPNIQPPTPCFLVQGDMECVDLERLIREHGAEFGLPLDFGWSSQVPGCARISMRADFHVYGVRCDRADDLTRAETEGRRLMRGFVRLLREHGNGDYALVNASAAMGVRDSRHFVTRRRAEMRDLLHGVRYDDPILRGTYRVDIHREDDAGITFLYLDGRRETFGPFHGGIRRDDWRAAEGLTGEPARWYELPFESLVFERWPNVLAAGRMLHADVGGFGALRVMVNLNQLGEAAGVAAALSLGGDVRALDGRRVSGTLYA